MTSIIIDVVDVEHKIGVSTTMVTILTSWSYLRFSEKDTPCIRVKFVHLNLLLCFLHLLRDVTPSLCRCKKCDQSVNKSDATLDMSLAQTLNPFPK